MKRTIVQSLFHTAGRALIFLLIPQAALSLGTHVRPASAAVETVCRAATSQRDATRLAQVLGEYGSFLELLPLGDLQNVRLTEAKLELHFDFDGNTRRKVQVPAKDLWILDEEGRPRREQSEKRTLRVKNRLVLDLGRRGIERVHKGDLEVKWGPFFLDLDVTTRESYERNVHDAHGHVVLETGAHGLPLRSGSGYIPKTASRWLVLEANGREVALPLGSGGSRLAAR